jgi:hypothetical protein
MTHIITADTGKWITEIGFNATQEDAPNFWREIRTSNPSAYEEVTNAEKEFREVEWHAEYFQHKPAEEAEELNE